MRDFNLTEQRNLKLGVFGREGPTALGGRYRTHRRDKGKHKGVSGQLECTPATPRNHRYD